MKRGGPLERRTPLTAKTELKRTSALNRSPLARSSLHANQATTKTTPKRRDTGPTAKVRALVHARSGGWCEWAGCWLVATDVHHRLNRKQGGRRGEASVRINRAAWLLDACRMHHDLVTSPHGAVRQLARESGWLLHEGEDARNVPVLSRHGLVWLNNDGTHSPFEPEEASMDKFDSVTHGTFRKTVTTEAKRWNPAEPHEVLNWLADAGAHFKVLDGGRLGIGTLESGDDLDRHAAEPGDWVLRGPAGEFYAHDAELFSQNYEQVA